jgi:hypothetical protein
MAASNDSRPTTYTIERACLVDVRDPVRVDTWAWLPVGEIVAEPDAEHFYYRDALVAWAGEQDGEPPEGRYRVIDAQAGGYLAGLEFEIREHRETIIERYERPVPAAVRDGVPADTAAALDESFADAAAAPGVE